MPLRMLVVDDNADVRFIVGAFVAHDDRFEVVGEAGDGAEVVGAVRALRPDVVLLDVNMPRRDGIATLADLAGLDERPIVVMYSSQGDRRDEALAAGADAWHTKTDPLTDVLDAIATLAGG